MAICVSSCPGYYVVWPAMSLHLLIVPLVVNTYLTTLSVAVQYVTSVIGEWMSAEQLWPSLGIRN